MAVTRTSRFALHRWDSGSDPYNRVQHDSDNLQIETLGAIFRVGTTATRGSASAAANARSFHYSTDDSTLVYSNGTNWVVVNGAGILSDIQALSIGGAASAGTTSTSGGVSTAKFALADHVHAMPAAGTPVAVTTSLAAGSASTLARSDHAHTIGTGSVSSSSMFGAGVVDATALATDAVVTAKIQDGAVSSSKLVTTAGTEAVTTAAIRSSAVTTAKISDSAVTTAKIADAAVTAAKIAAAIAGSGLSGGAGSALSVNVDGTTLEINAGNLRLKDAAVTAAKISSSAVTATKINADVAGSGLTQALSGALDVNADNSTLEISADALRIKDAGVTAAKLNSGVAGVAMSQNATSKVLDVRTDGSTILVNGSNQLYVASIAGSILTSDSVTAAKLNDDTAGLGLVRNGTSKALDVNVDGSTLEINVDTIRIKDGGVTALKLAAASVATANLIQTAGSEAVTTATIRSGAVTTAKLDTTLNSEAVTTATIRSGAVTAAKINGDVVGSGLSGGAGTALSVSVDNSTIEVGAGSLRVKDNGVTAAKINSSALGNGLTGGSGTVVSVSINSTLAFTSGVLGIASGGVGATQLNQTSGSEAVVTAAIRSGAVTTAKLDSTLNAEAVTTSVLRNSAVTTDKINAGAVTGSKAGAGTYRNATNTDTGGRIFYGTVSAMNTATASTTGFANGDIWLGY